MNQIQSQFTVDVDLLRDSEKEIYNNTKIIIKTAKEVRLEVNVDKAKYVFTGSNYINITQKIIINNTFESVDKFKY